MSLAACLERIGYVGSTRPDRGTLAALQRAFLLAVPFENLDVHLGRAITLEPERVFEKIVEERRGGFCYECNSLFHEMLVALGYSVQYVSARMVVDGRTCPEFDHMALLVHLDSDYLVDVGNGQSCRQPLRLDGGNLSTSEGISYRVTPHRAGLALEFRTLGARWAPRYLFSTVPRKVSDYAEMCRYHQTAPESLFTRHRLATLALPDGRATLLDFHLTLEDGSRRRERDVHSEAEWRACLREHFHLDLDSGAEERSGG